MLNDYRRDSKDLTIAQFELLITHYRQLIALQIHANNELVARLNSSKAFKDVDRRTLREWSHVINELNAAFEAEVRKIVSANELTVAG